MPRGRTNQPLVVYVAPEYEMSPPVESLRQQGHTIVVFASSTLVRPDLILHPAAHQWNDMMWDFLPAAIIAARKRKREAKG